MSAPVDVLAVMDAAIGMCGGVTDETGAQVANARAAVAELIEATQRTRAGLPVLHGLILGTFGEESGGARKAEMFMRELDAALALVGAA